MILYLRYNRQLFPSYSSDSYFSCYLLTKIFARFGKENHKQKLEAALVPSKDHTYNDIKIWRKKENMCTITSYNEDSENKSWNSH